MGRIWIIGYAKGSAADMRDARNTLEGMGFVVGCGECLWGFAGAAKDIQEMALEDEELVIPAGDLVALKAAEESS